MEDIILDDAYYLDRLPALDSVLHYLYEAGHLNHREIYKACGLSHDEYYNIWRVKRPNFAHITLLYKYVLNYLRDKIVSVPSWIRPTFNFCFPILPQFQDKTNAFQECANKDPDQRRRLFDTYVGTYTMYRYAASINVQPVSPQVEEYNPAIERDNIKARVVRAAMTIFRDGSSPWPSFQIYYVPRRPPGDVEPIPSVEGNLIPIGDHVYYVGTDKSFMVPLIMVTEKVAMLMNNVIEGIMLRRHERNRIFASRVVMIKRENTTFREECSKTGLLREGELDDEFSSVKDRILNEVEQLGKAALILGGIY